ncbi:MAG: tRNA (N(6)-L-threonylcarbamoyladenosine(37)-C(2))-methylthiotransferase MtaB [Clostridiales bacterium]|nr:tRNA (N(6)-L-threonylcarbamoyladenosine(37)-C(2))-methylthiotransferase MtaB [Clostridiales bacterium]
MTEKNIAPRAAVMTLGCRVNQYESEAVCERLAELGFEICDFSEKCDVYIINTCAVTAESERKSRQMVRRAASQNKDAAVIVMGCSSQLHGDKISKIGGVYYVCGNRNKLSAADFALSLCRGDRSKAANVLDVEEAPLEKMSIKRSDRTRAYVKIEDGCDNNCAYCIIKKARGNVVSRLCDDICAEVEVLADAGYREVVLTGIETASFGKDTGEKLSDLISRVAKNEKIERIRLGSLEPSVLTRGFIDALASEKKFMPSFHLSLQSGSSRVLALMKRKYNADMVLSSVSYIKEKIPDATFTCDIIVGFPQETEDDFIQTCNVAKAIRFLHMHIFPFSPREGTAAAQMSGQISEEEKHSRLVRLEKIGDEISDAIYKNAVSGGARDVLFETPEGEYQVGHTPEMMEIRVKCGENLAGRILRVIPEKYVGGKPYGKLERNDV